LAAVLSGFEVEVLGEGPVLHTQSNAQVEGSYHVHLHDYVVVLTSKIGKVCFAAKTEILNWSRKESASCVYVRVGVLLKESGQRLARRSMRITGHERYKRERKM
jgi:hypothetical protein